MLPVLQYTWGYFFCMFSLRVLSSDVSPLHKWMYITSCWSWTNATKWYHWTKRGERIFQPDRIPTFEDLLGWLLCSAKTMLSPGKQNFWNNLCHHIADVLRQVASNLSVGSQTEILPIARKWTFFHREVPHGQHNCGQMHILFFFHPFGESGQGHASNSLIAFWMCWLGELLEKIWITRSGCSKPALHPLLLGFLFE